MARNSPNSENENEKTEGKGRDELDERIEDQYGSLPDNLAKEMRSIPKAKNAEQK